MTTFEDYLKENHAKHYRGLDDDMPDAYEKWVTELDLSTVMELAEEAMEEATKEEHARMIHRVGDFRDDLKRTVRFYECPSNEHKIGDDGSNL